MWKLSCLISCSQSGPLGGALAGDGRQGSTRPAARLDQIAPISCERNMDKLIVLGFLIAATSLEAIGDAIVRVGLGQSTFALRCLLFVAGATFLFGYGLSLNLAPVEFSRV